MQFFGVGMFELAMIMIVALIVVGPDKLPQTAREIGKVVRTVRRYAYSVQREVTEGFSELTDEVEATKGEFRDLGESLKVSGRAVERELEETSDLARGEFVDAESDPAFKRPRARNGAARPKRGTPRSSTSKRGAARSTPQASSETAENAGGTFVDTEADLSPKRPLSKNGGGGRNASRPAAGDSKPV